MVNESEKSGEPGAGSADVVRRMEEDFEAVFGKAGTDGDQ